MAKRKLENVLVAAGLVVLVLLLSMFGSLLILIIASNKLSVDMLFFVYESLFAFGISNSILPILLYL